MRNCLSANNTVLGSKTPLLGGNKLIINGEFIFLQFNGYLRLDLLVLFFLLLPVK